MFIKVKYTYIFSHHNTRSPANQWIKLQELVFNRRPFAQSDISPVTAVNGQGHDQAKCTF